MELYLLCFTNRLVDACYSLPNYVATGKNTNVFKRRLDAYCRDQDI